MSEEVKEENVVEEVKAPETAPETQTEKMLSQSEVNNLVARETKKAQEKLFKQMGIEGDSKEGMSKFKEWQENQKSEAERTAEKLKQLDELNNTVLEKDIKIEALKSGIKPEQLDKFTKLAKLDDSESIDDKIKATLEGFPEFLQQNKEIVPPKDFGGDTNNNEKTSAEKEADIIMKGFGV